MNKSEHMKNLHPRSILVLIVSLLMSISFAANTNISGIVNSYASVGAIGANNITVGAFAPSYTPSCGDRIMLIQMKGASISTANNSNFGNITSINNAGNYEVLTIESISGSVLTFTQNLSASYTIAGLVQAVYVPRYEDATVTGAITASPWDGTVGGVVAIEADGTITLNADIDVSTQGFRGGNFHLTSQVTPNGFACGFFNFFNNGNVGDQWVYNAADQRFAVEKGESIIDFANIWGKGKLATGGGGGGIESGGGGGGANYGTGGDAGGGNPASTGLGCTLLDVAGKGGASLSGQIPGGKIFLGGGSGAGNNGNEFSGTSPNYFGGAANTDPAIGRNGGGIIYISANEIIGNGQSILANGEDGYTPSGSVDNFGGSGGGAGGFVLLEANSFTGAINTEAKGGMGSSVQVTVTSSRRRGAGGGGGGGVVWFSGGSVPAGANVDVAGGARGLSYFNTNTLSPAQYGTVGGNGATLTGLSTGAADIVESALVSATASDTKTLNAGMVTFSDGGIIAKLNPNGNNLGSTVATVTTGSTGPFTPSNGCGALDEYYMTRVYSIVPTNQPTTACDVSIYVTQAELASFIAFTNGLGTVYDNCWGAVNSINDLIITADHSSGTKEVIIPTATFLVCADAWRLDFSVSEFSTFYIHSNSGLFNNNLLPVELLDFSVKSENTNLNVLTWTTATEINNAGFEVQRSYDGEQFEKIAWVVGNGNSNEIQEYAFEDYLLDGKINVENIYYKLKQIDFNEEYAYSPIEVVRYEVAEIANAISVFPNPANNFVKLQSTSENIEEVQFYSSSGRLLKRVKTDFSKEIEINIDFLNPGMYFLRIISSGGVVTSQLQVSY